MSLVLVDRYALCPRKGVVGAQRPGGVKDGVPTGPPRAALTDTTVLRSRRGRLRV